MADPGKKVLVVEDEADIRELMLLHLKRAGFNTASAENGEDALGAVSRQSPDLVVLDWMLPGLSGLEVCKKLAGRVPILMVTARSEPADIVQGLEAGADDYIVKPFEIPIFLARVKAVLRRYGKRSLREQETRLRIGNLELDRSSYGVFCGATEIHLTSSEFKLLSALMENPGRVFSRDQLIALVQGAGITVVGRAIDTHVFGLRKKLGPCADVIETVRGVGYRVKGSE